MTPEPRDRARRIADTRARLEDDIDLLIATVDGPDLAEPHLIPLSFVWDGSAVLLSTARESATVRNVVRSPEVRLFLGHTRDVVMVAGTAAVVEVGDVDASAAERFTRTGFDPRTLAPRYVFIVVTPREIRAWREENELAHRLVMREGRWLSPD